MEENADNRYVALLRGINVGGNKRVKMADLVSLFTDAGRANVATYIQSGNVLFDTPEPDAAALAGAIEERLLAKLGFDVTVIVRSVAALRAVVASAPFPEHVGEGPPPYLNVAFLDRLPDADAWSKLLAVKDDREELWLAGCDVYSRIYRDPGDLSPFAFSRLEKLLRVKATVRNWNTVRKLAT